jgi:hypothetical protein
MIDFSSGSTRQLLRSIIPLADGRLFGIMPGALGETAAFGAKLISVFPAFPLMPSAGPALFARFQCGLPAVVDALGFDCADARIREMR